MSAYNLPGSFTNGGVLSLTGLSWCRIYRGNITQWDDPDIIATNPGFNYASLTATTRKLRVLVLSTGSATHLAFSTYCNKIDPAYTQAGTMIKPNVLPIYPTASYAAVAFYPDVDLMVSTCTTAQAHRISEHSERKVGCTRGTRLTLVRSSLLLLFFQGSALSDLPFSFCMNTLSNARTINLAIGAFVNREGRTIVPNTNSMSLNLFELATNGYAAGTNSYDLTNPSTAQAWPILTMSYIFVDKSSAITTCASKRQMTEFFL
ncbi:MAG: hypothetical protein Q7T57_00300 [Dehalococcoidales bacterium]|nr:hypothetical protein [Dehalococcoidales bacterium]